MRENGQIRRLWKKWGSAISALCLESDETKPIKFQDVMMVFIIIFGALILVFFLVIVEYVLYKHVKPCRLPKDVILYLKDSTMNKDGDNEHAVSPGANDIQK